MSKKGRSWTRRQRRAIQKRTRLVKAKPPAIVRVLPKPGAPKRDIKRARRVERYLNWTMYHL